MLGNLIGGFIVILVGTSLLPTVAQQVGTAQADGNVTGAADTLVGLTTLFYSLAIAIADVAIARAKNKVVSPTSVSEAPVTFPSACAVPTC